MTGTQARRLTGLPRRALVRRPSSETPFPDTVARRRRPARSGQAFVAYSHRAAAADRLEMD